MKHSTSLCNVLLLCVVHDEVVVVHDLTVVGRKIGRVLPALGEMVQILLRARLRLSIVAGPDKTGLVEDAERAEEILNCCHEATLHVRVLCELHSAVKWECMNGCADELLIGLVGLVGKEQCVIILTHDVLILHNYLYSIFASIYNLLFVLIASSFEQSDALFSSVIISNILSIASLLNHSPHRL